MLETMEAYFAGEKGEALIFLDAGIVAVMLGAALLFRGRFFKGLAIPLIAVALIHMTVGATVYLRTDDQVAALTAQLQVDPAGYRRDELARMRVVNANFDLYRRVELALLAGSLLTAGLGAVRKRPMLAGAGTGLALQAAFSLLLDHVAEARADVYTAAVLALPLPLP